MSNKQEELNQVYSDERKNCALIDDDLIMRRLALHKFLREKIEYRIAAGRDELGKRHPERKNLLNTGEPIEDILAGSRKDEIKPFNRRKPAQQAGPRLLTEAPDRGEDTEKG